MFYDIFFVGRDTAEWKSLKSKYPTAHRVESGSFQDIQKQVLTRMFYVIWEDVILSEDFNLKSFDVPKWDQQYVHVFRNGIEEYRYAGLCLFPKTASVSNKEFTNRFFIEKKEVDITATTPKLYDIFHIDTFEDYQNALAQTTTEMFWIVPKEVSVVESFKFDFYITHDNIYDRKINHVFQHVFRNENVYNGVMLMSKKFPVSAKEINFRFLIEKKQHETVASVHKPYDIVFISYNELNADENYEKLKMRFPLAKRVHGVKGIHQAHIEAAKLADTDMFWVVDADALIDSDFNFDYQVSRYERDIVHVWQSKNPINDLIYGYGGVKLLPRQLTLNVDTQSADMTTSISKRFKPMEAVSNITAFNVDAFSTWRSAFRECVKLSSRTIRGQVDDETENRLNTWCTLNESAPYGFYAYSGAISGKHFGILWKNDASELAKINDFGWLQEQFNLVKEEING